MTAATRSPQANGPSRPLVIVGAGELAELAFYYFAREAGREVAAFAVDRAWRRTDHMLGRPVVEAEDLPATHPSATFELFIAIGYTQLNAARARRCAQARAAGYTLASHESVKAACAADAAVGGNCLLMEGVCVQPFVRLGEGIVAFAGAVVSHHATVGDHCFLGPGAIVCGGVTLGPRTFIGAGAVVREHLTVGSDCVIGAAAVVKRSVGDGRALIAAATGDSGLSSERVRTLMG